MIRFEEGGWWLPDGEEHLQQWMTRVNKHRDERLLYQGHKYERALKWVRSRHVAVDVGAHVGLWSWPMSKDFARVVAFEPVKEHQACWRANMAEVGNARLYPVALGEVVGSVRMKCRMPGSSGDTGVDPIAERSSLRASVDTEGEQAELCRLDDYQLSHVSFMKLDCEGYELFVLRGAIETLKRSKPCLIVEQKKQTGMEERYNVHLADVVQLLTGLGARYRAVVQGDYIFSWG